MHRKLSRLRPRPGRAVLAIAAVGAVSAAVVPALAPAAAASAAPAVAAGQLGLGGQMALAPGQVLMINGDRLFVRPAPGSELTSLIPAPLGGPVMTLHLHGATYDFPVDALPYLGTGWTRACST